MSVMKIKRGTTEAWHLGKEYVDFENFAIKDKDSVVDCCKNTITMTIGAPSMNTVPAGSSKQPGIAIIKTSDWSDLPSEIMKVAIKAEPVDPSNTHFSTATWGVRLYAGVNGGFAYDSLISSTLGRFQHSITYDVYYNGLPTLFVVWNEDTCNNPFDVKITFSFREDINESGNTENGETLVPGQLGAEYFTNGGVGLKIGQYSSGDKSEWDNIPYVGQVLPSCMYGSEADMNRLSNPVPGQLFFVKVT